MTVGTEILPGQPEDDPLKEAAVIEQIGAQIGAIETAPIAALIGATRTELTVTWTGATVTVQTAVQRGATKTGWAAVLGWIFRLQGAPPKTFFRFQSSQHQACPLYL